MPARALMFMGTGSDVGKSLMVAGLCRLLTNRGMRVAPFKPQNMSNNAAVTGDGGEIGRAQALQARAARLRPTVDMNPVLLKPETETGAQIIVRGQMRGSARAREFQDLKRNLLPEVLQSFEILRNACDLVLIEGAGSASEINLRANDIANMGFAEAAKISVILIGDIDRGGVIASLVGTKHVLPEADAARIKGFIVNKMRGDPSLFAAGMDAIARLTGWQALGLVPFVSAAATLPAEDALALSQVSQQNGPQEKLSIVVPVLPRISNFDDLDPLRLQPGVSVQMVHSGPLPDADVILIPGSKSTIADLDALRERGWDIDIKAHVRRGGHVLGLCGGYQMLGQSISDPHGIEGAPRSVDGLGLLNIETVMTTAKVLREVSGQLDRTGASFYGYEMHVGETTGSSLSRPFLRFADGRSDGAVSVDGKVAGCYVHGLFASDATRQAWIMSITGHDASQTNYESAVEAALDTLAAHLEKHVDIDQLLSLAS